MKTSLLLLVCCVVAAGGFSHSEAQEISMQARLTGKWTQHYTGMTLQGATLNITSVDSVNGQLKGKWIPPVRPSGGQGVRSDWLGELSSTQRKTG